MFRLLLSFLSFSHKVKTIKTLFFFLDQKTYPRSISITWFPNIGGVYNKGSDLKKMKLYNKGIQKKNPSMATDGLWTGGAQIGTRDSLRVPHKWSKSFNNLKIIFLSGFVRNQLNPIRVGLDSIFQFFIQITYQIELIFHQTTQKITI